MSPSEHSCGRAAGSARLGRGPRLIVSPSDHDLTVIIPAFNEERRLPRTLAELTAYLSAWGVDYRVLVVDDGSHDATHLATAEHHPRCSTIRLTRNGGKGRAVRTAMLQATGRVLAFTDADLPFDLAALRLGYETIARRECEIVFGARNLAGAEHTARRRLIRRVATFVFHELVRRLVPLPVTDTQCGLKLFARHAALEIFARATIDGFAFDTEIVALAQHLGIEFQQIPVRLVNEYSSSLSLTRSALPMLADVLRLSFRLRFTPGWDAPQIIYESGGDSLDQRKQAA
jgi:dolichyl-phosphate beta-glucosyltransferase